MDRLGLAGHEVTSPSSCSNDLGAAGPIRYREERVLPVSLSRPGRRLTQQSQNVIEIHVRHFKQEHSNISETV